MQMEKQSYYMVLPAEVWGSNKLTPNAKILFGHIQVLANKEKYCYAGNKTLSEIMGVSEKTIKQYLKELDDLEFISRTLIYKEGTQEIKERRIYINVGMTGSTKPSPGKKSNSTRRAQKIDQGPGTKTPPYNNTSLNTIKPSSHACESGGGSPNPEIMFNELNEEELVRKHKEDSIAKELNWKLLETLWTSTESYTEYLKPFWIKIPIGTQEEILSFVKENKNLFTTTTIWKKNFLKDNNSSLEWLKKEVQKKKKSSGSSRPGQGLTDFNL